MTEEAQNKMKEYKRNYYQKNKEQWNNYQREWRRNNKDKVQQYLENYWNKKASEVE